MKSFVVLVVVAVLASAPALVLRVIGLRPGPLMDAAIFGVAILAAGFHQHLGDRMTFHAIITSRRRIH